MKTKQLQWHVYVQRMEERTLATKILKLQTKYRKTRGRSNFNWHLKYGGIKRTDRKPRRQG